MKAGADTLLLRVKIALFCLFMTSVVYAQQEDVGPVETPAGAQDAPSEATGDQEAQVPVEALSGEGKKSPDENSAIEPEALKEPAPVKKDGTKTQNQKAAPKEPRKSASAGFVVRDDFFKTPEDPSFLYETRYIPGHKQEEEFLNRELEREVIEERILEAEDFQKTVEGIRMKLPSLTQVAVFTGIIILFILYRLRLKKTRRR